jgi:hypothetical protein
MHIYFIKIRRSNPQKYIVKIDIKKYIIKNTGNRPAPPSA